MTNNIFQNTLNSNKIAKKKRQVSIQWHTNTEQRMHGKTRQKEILEDCDSTVVTNPAKMQQDEPQRERETCRTERGR